MSYSRLSPTFGEISCSNVGFSLVILTGINNNNNNSDMKLKLALVILKYLNKCTCNGSDIGKVMFLAKAGLSLQAVSFNVNKLHLMEFDFKI
jgi:hypothetical protein